MIKEILNDTIEVSNLTDEQVGTLIEEMKTVDRTEILTKLITEYKEGTVTTMQALMSSRNTHRILIQSGRVKYQTIFSAFPDEL